MAGLARLAAALTLALAVLAAILAAVSTWPWSLPLPLCARLRSPLLVSAASALALSVSGLGRDHELPLSRRLLDESGAARAVALDSPVSPLVDAALYASDAVVFEEITTEGASPLGY